MTYNGKLARPRQILHGQGPRSGRVVSRFWILRGFPPQYLRQGFSVHWRGGIQYKCFIAFWQMLWDLPPLSKFGGHVNFDPPPLLQIQPWVQHLFFKTGLTEPSHNLNQCWSRSMISHAATTSPIQHRFQVSAKPMKDCITLQQHLSLAECKPRFSPAIDLIHKSQNVPVPYPTMLHSEQKCAHFCSEWSIAGYGTGTFWDLWNWSIQAWHHLNFTSGNRPYSRLLRGL